MECVAWKCARTVVPFHGRNVSVCPKHIVGGVFCKKGTREKVKFCPRCKIVRGVHEFKGVEYKVCGRHTRGVGGDHAVEMVFCDDGSVKVRGESWRVGDIVHGVGMFMVQVPRPGTLMFLCERSVTATDTLITSGHVDVVVVTTNAITQTMVLRKISGSGTIRSSTLGCAMCVTLEGGCGTRFSVSLGFNLEFRVHPGLYDKVHEPRGALTRGTVQALEDLQHTVPHVVDDYVVCMKRKRDTQVFADVALGDTICCSRCGLGCAWAVEVPDTWVCDVCLGVGTPTWDVQCDGCGKEVTFEECDEDMRCKNCGTGPDEDAAASEAEESTCVEVADDSTQYSPLNIARLLLDAGGSG